MERQIKSALAEHMASLFYMPNTRLRGPLQKWGDRYKSSGYTSLRKGVDVPELHGLDVERE